MKLVGKTYETVAAGFASLTVGDDDGFVDFTVNVKVLT